MGFDVLDDQNIDALVILIGTYYSVLDLCVIPYSMNIDEDITIVLKRLYPHNYCVDVDVIQPNITHFSNIPDV
jgi:hypothetical protein